MTEPREVESLAMPLFLGEVPPSSGSSHRLAANLTAVDPATDQR